MGDWAIFPDLFEQFLTDQQPAAYPFEYPLPHEFDTGDELASHSFISAQQTANLLEPLHPPSLSQEYLVPMPQDKEMASVNDAELNAAVMGPPQKRRKKKAPTLRDEDWEPYKDRILELRDTEEFSLLKIKETIEEEFDFTAELRQYQSRISKWGKDKNIKGPEMAAIVRKRQQRKLVEVDKREQVFSVRGRNVEPQKINRWMTRYGVSQTSLYAPSPATSTPSAVLCRTISERGSVTLSPAYITSLNVSPRSTLSITPIPTTSSTIPSKIGMRYSQNSGFDTQSHVDACRPVLTISTTRQPLISDVFPFDRPPLRHIQDVEEALSVAECSLGAYHSQTLELRIELGRLLTEQGRFRPAEEVTRRVVEDCEKTENSLDIKLVALDILIVVLHLQVSCHQARKLQEQTFELRKVNFGEEHPSTVRSMIDLCWGNVLSGKINESEELCAQASKMSKKTFGESHPETLRATSLLVYTYTKQGRLNEAERLGLESLKKAMAVLGDGHQHTLDCMSRLALVYHKQGRSEDADQQLRQVLKTSVQSLGENHPETIYNRRSLVAVYRSQGRLEEAQDLGEQVLTTAQRVLGEHHHLTLMCIPPLIEIYEDRGQLAKAEELKEQKQVLERRALERQEDVCLDFSMAAWFTCQTHSSSFRPEKLENDILHE